MRPQDLRFNLPCACSPFIPIRYCRPCSAFPSLIRQHLRMVQIDCAHWCPYTVQACPWTQHRRDDLLQPSPYRIHRSIAHVRKYIIQSNTGWMLTTHSCAHTCCLDPSSIRQSQLELSSPFIVNELPQFGVSGQILPNLIQSVAGGVFRCREQPTGERLIPPLSE